MTGELPRHVGFIPDGGRRAARRQGQPIAEGHRRSRAKITEVCGWCEETGIEVVTLFALSAGNLGRDASERLPSHAEDCLSELVAVGRWRVNPIGSLELLSPGLRTAAASAEEQTAGNRELLVNVALGYTGRQDIIDAVRRFLRDPTLASADAEKLAALLTVEEIDRRISTAGQPDLDLIIRTSGEQRLSGFLTWQAEQSELYFSPRTWPEFQKTDLLEALADYADRQRRFGA